MENYMDFSDSKPDQNVKQEIQNWHDFKQEHFEIKPETKPFICEICEAAFTTHSGLKTHNRIHERDRIDVENPWKECPECNKKLKTEKSLIHHIREFHDNIRDFKCDQCPKAFYKMGKLNDHKKLEHERELIECDFCGKELFNKHSFKLHVRICKTKPEKKPLPCDLCEKAFFKLPELKKHYKDDHEGYKPKNHNCEICAEAFHSRADLREHIRVDHQGNLLQCDVCHEELKKNSPSCHSPQNVSRGTFSQMWKM